MLENVATNLSKQILHDYVSTDVEVACYDP